MSSSFHGWRKRNRCCTLLGFSLLICCSIVLVDVSEGFTVGSSPSTKLCRFVLSQRRVRNRENDQRSTPFRHAACALSSKPSGDDRDVNDENVVSHPRPEDGSSDPLSATSSAAGSEQSVREVEFGDVMAAFGTSPRRIFLSFASAGAIALGADFCGVTQGLLSSLPEDVAESTGLDSYYPRDGMKRFRGVEYGYTFLYPKQWVGDTYLELAKAQRRTKNLDYSMKSARADLNTYPDTAFGPPGQLNSKGTSQSDTNVSVIATPVPASFQSLQKTLGSPQSAAETLLRVSLAPEGSGRIATLLSANEDDRGGTVYQFEYLVDRGSKGVSLRAISAIAVRPIGSDNKGNVLLTLTVVAPMKDWETDIENLAKLKKVADSFKLVN